MTLSLGDSVHTVLRSCGQRHTVPASANLIWLDLTCLLTCLFGIQTVYVTLSYRHLTSATLLLFTRDQLFFVQKYI